jgi:pyrroline-5-carboxylate reductase
MTGQMPSNPGTLPWSVVAAWAKPSSVALSPQVPSAASITVAEPSAERRAGWPRPSACGLSLTARMRCRRHRDFGGQPQVIDGRHHLSAELAGSLVVSIAWGVERAARGTASFRLRGRRVMPNTPALVGKAMPATSGSEATAEQIGFVAALFGELEAPVLDERHRDAAAAIRVRGRRFALWSTRLPRGRAPGLTRGRADPATQTMLGTATMLAETAIHPEKLVDGVAVRGTTIAAVEALEARALRAAFAEAVAAAVRRAKELG